MAYQSVYKLVEEMKDSPIYKEYIELKKQIDSNESQSALLKEYKKIQTSIQMLALTQGKPSEEDMKKFSALSTLLYSNPNISEFLIKEMRIQQAIAEVIKIISEGLDLAMDIPDIPSI